MRHFNDRSTLTPTHHPRPPARQIHWLSIINSFVLVLLLTAFLAVILMRVLKNDFSRYMEMDEDDIVEEEGGWKLIHGDVFRFPQVRFLGKQICVYVWVVASAPAPNATHTSTSPADSHLPPSNPQPHQLSPLLKKQRVNLFAALMGSGVHLCVVTLILLCCALGGVFRATKRGVFFLHGCLWF